MYKPLQKKSSSWTVTSIQKKSKSFSKPGSSAVQASRDANSAESQDMPSYSTSAADLLTGSIMRSVETEEQEQVETSTVQRQSDSGRAAVAAVAPPIVSIPVVQPNSVGIQRQCSECATQQQQQSEEEGKDVLEMSGAVSGIQTKLTVGAPGDAYEQEADRVAAQVMSMPIAAAAGPQVQRFGVEDSPIGMYSSLARSITPVVHRRVDQQVQMYLRVQRAFRGDGNEASGDLESRLNASKGGGSALAPEVRAFMEPRFGADFSSVRVHTGGEAVQMNRELGAQAFAHGSDIYFGAGKSPGNNELTAHELTHVVQQKGISHIQRESAPSNHEKMLDEAINIVQHTLNALAAQSLGENNTNVTTTPEAKHQEQGLRTVLDHLRSLKGSGKVDEILQLTQPILAAARGDLAGANHTQGEQLSQQEPSQGSTPTIQRFPLVPALAGGGALAAEGGVLAGIVSGPVGWTILAVAAVGTVGYLGYKAYEASRSRPVTETPPETAPPTTVAPPASVPVPPTTVAPPISVPRAVPRAVPRTRTRRRRRGPYPIDWPYLGGRGLPLVAPNPANSIFVNRRLVRTTPPPRNLALIDQFKATHAVQTGQAVHHVTPLFLGGPDALGNLVALWMSYHNRGHAALRNQPHLAAYGISTDLYQHPPGTPYFVRHIV